MQASSEACIDFNTPNGWIIVFEQHELYKFQI